MALGGPRSGEMDMGFAIYHGLLIRTVGYSDQVSCYFANHAANRFLIKSTTRAKHKGRADPSHQILTAGCWS
jgi:hypothetical protein